jgi:hypothetical protein
MKCAQENLLDWRPFEHQGITRKAKGLPTHVDTPFKRTEQ